MQSFLWRAYCPQAVLFLVISYVHANYQVDFLVVDIETALARNHISEIRLLTMILGIASAWVLGMVMTGFFQTEWKLASFVCPDWPEGVWIVMLVALVCGSCLFLFLCDVFMQQMYVFQLLAYLLFSIKLYNVFSTTLGPAILEQAKAEKSSKDRKDAAALIRIKIREAEAQIAEYQSSPLVDELTEAIKQLDREIKSLKQQLQVVEGGLS